MHRVVLPAVLLTLMVALVPAGWAADELNIKSGQWEITTTVRMDGPPPIPQSVLDHLTPEQRASLQERMKGIQFQGPLPIVKRQCVTQKDIDKAFDSALQSQTCTRTVVTATPRLNESTIACNGQIQGSGKLHIEAPTPDHITGLLDATRGDTHVKATIDGKWLSADCPAEKK
jgi:hypothetical protein